MKANKYRYYKVIQQYCNGWEDASFYETNSNYKLINKKSGIFYTNKYGRKQERNILTCDYQEYIAMGYPIRIIKRRELIK